MRRPDLARRCVREDRLGRPVVADFVAVAYRGSLNMGGYPSFRVLCPEGTLMTGERTTTPVDNGRSSFCCPQAVSQPEI